VEAYRLNTKNELFKIEETTGYFDTWDGSQLYTVSWVPSGMRALVILVHGLGEHIVRYKYWASFFYENRIGVIGFDLRGHGHNKGQRGSCNYDDCLKDIRAFIANSHERFPFIPKILYGQSLGGNLVLQYIIENKPTVAGVISTSPWLKLVNSPPQLLLNILKKLGKFLPVITVSNGLNALDLSHDRRVMEAYLNDPLVHKWISPDLYFKAIASGIYILQNRHKINVPLLLMHGTSDNVTSCYASADFANFTSDYTTLRLWKDGFHELHNEFDKADIFFYILQWMESLPSVQLR
jgi:alpha-beta hydrolase superfamily lysophospholipase